MLFVTQPTSRNVAHFKSGQKWPQNQLAKFNLMLSCLLLVTFEFHLFSSIIKILCPVLSNCSAISPLHCIASSLVKFLISMQISAVSPNLTLLSHLVYITNVARINWTWQLAVNPWLTHSLTLKTKQKERAFASYFCNHATCAMGNSKLIKFSQKINIFSFFFFIFAVYFFHPFCYS